MVVLIPGPVKMRPTGIGNNKRANSYPPTNPSRDIMIVVPIMSIMKRPLLFRLEFQQLMLPRLSAPTIRLVIPLLANQRHVKISVL